MVLKRQPASLRSETPRCFEPPAIETTVVATSTTATYCSVASGSVTASYSATADANANLTCSANFATKSNGTLAISDWAIAAGSTTTSLNGRPAAANDLASSPTASASPTTHATTAYGHATTVATDSVAAYPTIDSATLSSDGSC